MQTEEWKASLKKLQLERYAYNHASACIYFDSATIAPRGSTEARSMALGILSEKSYHLFANNETRNLLDELRSRRTELDELTLRQVELLSEELDDLTRIPVQEYVAYNQLTNEASSAWVDAKEQNEYALFRPYLSKVLAYRKRFAGYKDATRPVYDVLLDEHEKGMSMETLDRFFAMLRERLVPLIGAVKDQPIDTSFLRRPCPIIRQRELSDELMRIMGIDRAHCAIAETEHPFTEGGHALYDLGIADEYAYTCLADGASMGIHESQSRLYENMIGHSAPFLRFLYPRLREFFPDAFAGVNGRMFYCAANAVCPSLIRTEADEVTYPLHVMVRYELEKQLVSGSLTVEDLPAAWNALYKEYLGLDVPSDTMGVLQDMHWSDGSFGYLPTYALGSAYAAQFMAAMRKELDTDVLMEKGDLAPITAWLQSHVHRYGKLKNPADLMMKACGEAFDPQYYVEHLSTKVREIENA